MRRVSFLQFARRSFSLMIGVVLLWCGAILVFITATTIRDESRYKAARHTTNARVTSKLLRRATEQTGTAYLLTFRVDRDAGLPIERTEEVPVALWESVDDGDTVPVEYVDQPERDARIRRDREPIAMYWGLLVFGAACTATGGFLSGGAARRIARQLAIARTGQTVEAVVTAVRETNYRINKVTQWAVEFQYMDHIARLHRGDSGPMSPGDADQWSPGDRATVKFDVQHPERYVWLGR